MPGMLIGLAPETPFVGTIIDRWVNDLPLQNTTTAALQVINSLTGETWNNPGNFHDTIRLIIGEDDEDLIRRVGSQAIKIYTSATEGYLDAIAIYQNVDKKTTLN